MRWIIALLIALNLASYYWLVLRPQPQLAAVAAPLPEGVARIELAGESRAVETSANAPLLVAGASSASGLCWYIGLARDVDGSGSDVEQAARILANVRERLRVIALEAEPVQIDVAGATEHWVQVSGPQLEPAQLLKQLLADGFDVYLATTGPVPGVFPGAVPSVVAGPFASAVEAEQLVDELNAAGWDAQREPYVPTQRQPWLQISSAGAADPVPGEWWSETRAQWPGLRKHRYYCAGIAQSGDLE